MPRALSLLLLMASLAAGQEPKREGNEPEGGEPEKQEPAESGPEESKPEESKPEKSKSEKSGPAEPQPGLVNTSLVDVEELIIPAGEGDARKAHRTFLEAHEAHRRGDRDAALRGYLAYLGMEGHHELPSRYTKTVQVRLEALHEQVQFAHTSALTLYRNDRRKGLAELNSILTRYPMLPEGRAARILVHSDTTRAAVLEARELAEGKGKAEAARILEAAVRASPDSLFLYEAKRLLVKLGGPDLFDEDERIDSGTGSGPTSRRRDEGGDSVIEISEDPEKEEPRKEPK